MTHYDTLEVSPRASPEVLRAAYRSLIQRYHPDRHPGDAAAAARAAAITEAYDLLSDPERRAAYDAMLAEQSSTGNSGMPPAAPGGQGMPRGATGAASTVRRTSGDRRPSAQRTAPSSSGRWVLAGLALVVVAILLAWFRPHASPAPDEDWGNLRERFTRPGQTEEELRALLQRKEALLAQSPALRERDARELKRDREARSVELLDEEMKVYLTAGVITIPRIQLVLGSFDFAPLRSQITNDRARLVREIRLAFDQAKSETLFGPDGEGAIKAVILDALVRSLDTPPLESYPSTWHESPGRYGVVAVELPQRYRYQSHGAPAGS